MSRPELLKELKQRSDALRKDYENYKNLKLTDGQHDLTKQKIIDDVSAAWVSISQTITELDEFEDTIAPDKCYEAEKAFVTKTYNDYLAELLKTSTPIRKETETIGTPRMSRQNSEQTDDEEQSYRIFLCQQGTRIDATKKALSDVKKKVEANQLSAAYCRLKSKPISELWQRIQVSDEECELNRINLPARYFSDVETIGSEIETTLLILQEELEVVNGNNGRQNETLKLERITIPKFSGDYFKWTSFRDLFTTMVVDNKSLSNAQRMQLLKTKLQVDSEADILIRDFTISDANFDSAWARLTSRYDNNRVVVYKYLTKFNEQKPTNTESKSVKRLLDTTDQILSALKNLERPVETWDDWIVLTITQKLSEEVRKDWEKKIGSTTELPTWEQLKEFLNEEFRMLEGVENTIKKSRPQNGHAEKNNTRGIVQVYQASVENSKYPCPVCTEDHGIFSCAKFKAMDVAGRYELAKKVKLCFVCLKKHKDVLRCDKQKSCKRCDKPHSTWLHKENKNQEVTNAVGIIVNKEITTAIGAINEKQVLLATAIVTTTDSYGRRITLRALIDQGSQGSMITDKVATILQLDQMKTSNYISGLNGNNSGQIKKINLTISSKLMGVQNQRKSKKKVGSMEN